MTHDETFYEKLPPFDQFGGICSTENYVELPDDWVVLISDIKGSTEAIQNGRYRQVNAVGVASIVAVINALKPLLVPYVFGGDGATLCIPGNYLAQAQQALIATQVMAKTQFDLNLRVGAVANSVIQQSTFRVLVGKCRVSTGYFQAAFSGEGLAYAEKLVKGDQQYCFDADDSASNADFTGFECRWKDIPSPRDETVSILVMATSPSIETSNEIYRATLQQIQQIYGAVESHRPVQKASLQLTTESHALAHEVKIRAGFLSQFQRFIYALSLPWKVRLGRYWMAKGKTAIGADWGQYKDILVANTDFRKFDDTLRMVISGDEKQRLALDQYLQKHYQQGLLVYGIHSSPAALMTCVISNYNQDHVHFIDGSDGGYAMAAKALKQRLKVPQTG